MKHNIVCFAILSCFICLFFQACSNPVVATNDQNNTPEDNSIVEKSISLNITSANLNCGRGSTQQIIEYDDGNKYSYETLGCNSITLEVTFDPPDTTDKTIEWECDDLYVVRVSNDQAMNKQSFVVLSGESSNPDEKFIRRAQITAKSKNGKTAVCELTLVDFSNIFQQIYKDFDLIDTCGSYSYDSALDNKYVSVDSNVVAGLPNGKSKFILSNGKWAYVLKDYVGEKGFKYNGDFARYTRNAIAGNVNITGTPITIQRVETSGYNPNYSHEPFVCLYSYDLYGNSSRELVQIEWWRGISTLK
jgi:hypothetical protein